MGSILSQREIEILYKMYLKNNNTTNKLIELPYRPSIRWVTLKVHGKMKTTACLIVNISLTECQASQLTRAARPQRSTLREGESYERIKYIGLTYMQQRKNYRKCTSSTCIQRNSSNKDISTN